MKSHKPHPDKIPKIRTRALMIIAGVALLVMGVAFVLGFLIHHERITKREKMAQENRDKPPVVQVVPPKATQKSFDLTLPADVRAYATTSLYARTNGYLASWNYDINARVKKGDVLAVISAPDTDAELEEAQASLRQQQTNHQLASDTEQRFRGLIPIQGVTQQQLDQNRAAREQAGAGVESAAATVDRMKALVSFEKITAPFDGVVTARNYDVGALISATNIASGQELFQLAEDDVLRVFVNVPQAYSMLITFGQPVSLALERNYPGHKFTGVVARSAGTLEPVTRTLRTELDFKNDDPVGHIFPGMYGEAVFAIERAQPVLTVPTSALLFEPEGKEVAVVGEGDKIHFQKIVPGSDFGTDIEVVSGLKGDERIVSNPDEQLTEGTKVTIAPKKKDDGQGDQDGNGAKEARDGNDQKDNGRPGGDPTKRDDSKGDKDSKGDSGDPTDKDSR